MPPSKIERPNAAVRRAAGAALLILLLWLYFAANRGAFAGYFDSDAFDNITMANEADLSDYARGLLTPVFFSNNFRPIGHLFFRWMGQAVGWWFAAYVTVMLALHALDVVLLWLVMRRLGIGRAGCVMGAVFYALHAAVLSAYWQPLYAFDLLAGTLCLVTLLLWMDGHWLLSLLVFWLAFRTKEIVIFLPVLLAVYELLLGKGRERRWILQLIPFFLLSVIVGVQGVLHGFHTPGAYGLKLAIGQCASFYTAALAMTTPKPWLLPVFLVALGAVGAAVRDRRYAFGVAAFALLLAPMLIVPGRLFDAYLYVPLAGLGIAIAACGAKYPWVAGALLLLVWAPADYAGLRHYRREESALASDRKAYAYTLIRYTKRHPEQTTFLRGEGPLRNYGVSGLERWLHPKQPVTIYDDSDPAGRKRALEGTAAVLDWNPETHTLIPFVPAAHKLPYIDAFGAASVWQLQEGWFSDEQAFRWMEKHATAALERPAGAQRFEAVLSVNDLFLEAVHREQVRVSLNGQPACLFDITHAGVQTFGCDVAPAPEGTVEVAFDSNPPYPGDPPRGPAMLSFGFVNGQHTLPSK